MKNEVKRGKKEKGEKEQAKKMQKKVQYIYFFMFMQYNFKNAQKKNRLLQRAIPVYSLSIFHFSCVTAQCRRHVRPAW